MARDLSCALLIHRERKIRREDKIKLKGAFDQELLVQDLLVRPMRAGLYCNKEGFVMPSSRNHFRSWVLRVFGSSVHVK